MEKKNQAIKKAIDFFGGSQVKTAKKLNVSKSQVWQWLNNVNAIAIEKAIDIEDKTNGAVKCEELRPDVNWSVIRGRA
ncbi:MULTISPECIES: transcriptional regulator [unclassified Gilliamella]|uniref:transcriptional regulator n=1 Tax=unclassified Gilliamella TaxID=2685620 RepID=UPI00080E70FE|nr:Cro/CI family transcriptional regulator [Gilliamella apicola]OCG33673.1 Cro/Cl family transcriptional regulator [Gilliamella apicola]OCG49058.1 Cro/Cl family transcriptional regulator [Gilliamella apicola]OCG51806.1 Cro/Cl family transcriptional regulator [Gilliamella apicola]